MAGRVPLGNHALSLSLSTVMIVHYLVARASVVRHVVVVGVGILRRGNLEDICLIHGRVNRHDLLGEDRTLQMSMQIRLILCILLDDLLDVSGHVDVGREAISRGP